MVGDRLPHRERQRQEAPLAAVIQDRDLARVSHRDVVANAERDRLPLRTARTVVRSRRRGDRRAAGGERHSCFIGGARESWERPPLAFVRAQKCQEISESALTRCHHEVMTLTDPEAPRFACERAGDQVALTLQHLDGPVHALLGPADAGELAWALIGYVDEIAEDLTPEEEYEGDHPTHETVWIENEGRGAEIDRDIADLVLAMWQTGIHTTGSCQGDELNLPGFSFPTMEDAEAFINTVVTEFDESANFHGGGPDTLWVRAYRPTCCRFKDRWQLCAGVADDNFVDYLDEDNNYRVKSLGRPAARISISVKFPFGDLPAVRKAFGV